MIERRDGLQKGLKIEQLFRSSMYRKPGIRGIFSRRLAKIDRVVRHLLRRIGQLPRKYPRATPIAVLVAVLIAIIVLIPGVLVKHTGIAVTTPNVAEAPPAVSPHVTAPTSIDLDKLDTITLNGHPLTFPIYLSTADEIVRVGLESYVRGVLAAEMPIEFEPEALRAQAIAARTYIVKRFVDKDVSNVPVSGAWVTDTPQHQAYMTDEALIAKWPDARTRAVNIRKLNEAVAETSGQIILYKGAPIFPAFFSTSNGYTENSEQYWAEKLPYLRSVDSPWDAELSPKYRSNITFTAKEFAIKLGLPNTAVAAIASTGKSKAKTPPIRILETSTGKRVTKISIAGNTFTGREVREKLGLASTSFTIKPSGNQVDLTVYGNGHGVGMSQWGAQGMALAGRTATDIIEHYYTGVKVEKVDDLAQLLHE